MHFSTTLLTLLPVSVVLGSPVPGKHGLDLGSWKKDWEHKWGDDEWKHDEKVFYFKKTYAVKATSNQVRNGTTPVQGQPGAKGLFKFGINVEGNTICYNITLSGVTGDYQSPALTATHIHEAPKGASGPPRLAFPNPQGPDEKRVSYGCLTGPFKTGITANGKDTGEGFHVKQIVENAKNFFADTHTKQFPLGAVRGQLA
ncbi:hypothetical protein BDV96DRAFT_482403 [Lophiotrema nucula]|uniref:CHRD domain-containing protein n=1 Tax=Lophiotrema nucula TaxID=690887 RepID=A0A6A5ZTL2_9PLEO|nr:hypothetical protein BDV96DRAFT_482403 [Lophiotrema nucula]